MGYINQVHGIYNTKVFFDTLSNHKKGPLFLARNHSYEIQKRFFDEMPE